MNEILQQRIEEAAQRCATTTDGKIISFAYLAAKQMADWLLQNQWISVEEGLPEEKYLVLTRVKTPVGIVHRSDYYINDYWYMCRYNQEEIVTHWMPIPEIKGGEK